MSDPRAPLRAALAANAAHVADLERDRARIIAASESSNVDDEHDPEGATIAFEREQLTALLEQARSGRRELEHAFKRVESGEYGRCETCGRPIAGERLAARPAARTCLGCVGT